ncbi:MAG TPA: GGDEF domain-containing protein [Longimicrobium sp.]|nr:GGDEF domain-containing protein [Longimicrobium sp.]
MHDSRRKPKQRGLALATTGLALAVALLAALAGIGFVEVTRGEWVATVATTAAATGVCWLLLHAAPAAWKGWDPHFVFVPSLAVAAILAELIWAAPEIRTLVLVVWPVVLIFLAGYIDFVAVALLSALMGGGYLAAVHLARPPGLRSDAEAIVAAVFFITMLFAAVVLARIRRQRLNLAATRAELARLVSTDPLTGLPNRRHFQAVLEGEWARTRRYGTCFTLALLDLDHFKRVNDCFGHPAGDAVLHEIAVLMREQLRATDSVARIGGEEFGIVLAQTEPQTAVMVVERLRAALAAHRFHAVPNEARLLTASIGLAASAGSEPLAALMRRADAALYEAKALGRDQVVLAEAPVAVAHVRVPARA